jgi:hypothetical protein
MPLLSEGRIVNVRDAGLTWVIIYLIRVDCQKSWLAAEGVRQRFGVIGNNAALIQSALTVKAIKAE